MIQTNTADFYFAPQDQIQAAILNAADIEVLELCMGMYGFHLPPLRDQFIKNHENGLAQFLLLDLSQEAGKVEHPDVVAIINAGIDVVIGTSPYHNILHSKYLLAKKQCLVLSGSYNFSLSAAEQDNTLQAFYNSQVWDAYRTHFTNARQWCLDNEPQDQIKAALTAGRSIEQMSMVERAVRFPS